MYIYAASGLVRVEMQVSMGVNDTGMAKHKYEQWVYDLASVCVKEYHSNNGVYDSTIFREDCAEQDQKQYSAELEQNIRMQSPKEAFKQ